MIVTLSQYEPMNATASEELARILAEGLKKIGQPMLLEGIIALSQEDWIRTAIRARAILIREKDK